MPKIIPTIKPDMVALASLSIVPAKNPTLKITANINENHEKPTNNPIKDKIIATTSDTIVGRTIALKLIFSIKLLLSSLI